MHRTLFKLLPVHSSSLDSASASTLSLVLCACCQRTHLHSLACLHSSLTTALIAVTPSHSCTRVSTMPETAGTERQEEDRQLFDLDKHRSQSRQQLLSCRGQIAMKHKAKRRAELCMAEIQPLPEDTQAYKAVGRMSDSRRTTEQHHDNVRYTRWTYSLTCISLCALLCQVPVLSPAVHTV